jgi:hypothetical protein
VQSRLTPRVRGQTGCMRRWTDVVAGLAALALAVVVGLELRDVGFWLWVLVAAFAAAPVASTSA